MNHFFVNMRVAAVKREAVIMRCVSDPVLVPLRLWSQSHGGTVNTSQMRVYCQRIVLGILSKLSSVKCDPQRNMWACISLTRRNRLISLTRFPFRGIGKLFMWQRKGSSLLLPASYKAEREEKRK